MPTDDPSWTTNEYQHAARAQFFEAIRTQCPHVLDDLAGAPFEAYRKWLDPQTKRAQLIEVPAAPLPLLWPELEAWAARHQLADPWCVDIAFGTLDVWYWDEKWCAERRWELEPDYYVAWPVLQAPHKWPGKPQSYSAAFAAIVARARAAAAVKGLSPTGKQIRAELHGQQQHVPTTPVRVADDRAYEWLARFQCAGETYMALEAESGQSVKEHLETLAGKLSLTLRDTKPGRPPGARDRQQRRRTPRP